MTQKNTTIGQDLSGFRNLIHMNFDKDIVVLNQYAALSPRSEGMMEGVKYIITKGSKKPWEETKWAVGLKKMFPDLKVWYVEDHRADRKSIESFTGHPGRYTIVPTPRGCCSATGLGPDGGTITGGGQDSVSGVEDDPILQEF